VLLLRRANTGMRMGITAWGRRPSRRWRECHPAAVREAKEEIGVDLRLLTSGSLASMHRVSHEERSDSFSALESGRHRLESRVGQVLRVAAGAPSMPSQRTRSSTFERPLENFRRGVWFAEFWVAHAQYAYNDTQAVFTCAYLSSGLWACRQGSH